MAAHIAVVLGAAALIVFVVDPLINLLHEAGHAVAAVMLLDRDAYVYVGEEAPRWTFRLGRIHFEIDPLTAHQLADGDLMAEIGDLREGSRPRLAAVALAGPATSAVIAVAAGAAALMLGPALTLAFLVLVGAALAGLLGALDAIPLLIRGDATDGMRARRALRRRARRTRRRWRAERLSDGHRW